VEGNQRRPDIDQQAGQVLGMAHDGVDAAVHQHSGVYVASSLHFASRAKGKNWQPSKDARDKYDQPSQVDPGAVPTGVVKDPGGNQLASGSQYPNDAGEQGAIFHRQVLPRETVLWDPFGSEDQLALFLVEV